MTADGFRSSFAPVGKNPLMQFFAYDCVCALVRFEPSSGNTSR
jgi:hypothetical protein